MDQKTDSITDKSTEAQNQPNSIINAEEKKEDTKSKKKRRKKSILKKKNNQRKNSTSSSAGSGQFSDQNDVEATETSISISNIAASANTSSEGSPMTENELPSIPSDAIAHFSTKETEEIPSSDAPNTTSNIDIECDTNAGVNASRLRDLDIHFFSDTEVGYALSPNQSRPSSPVQSDTEFEMSQREKQENTMTSSASWKWGELPTQSDDPNSECNNTECEYLLISFDLNWISSEFSCPIFKI